MTTGVVIPQRLRASKTLQEGISSKYHVFDLLDGRAGRARHVRDVLHYPLGGLCLSGAGLTALTNR